MLYLTYQLPDPVQQYGQLERAQERVKILSQTKAALECTNNIWVEQDK